MSGSKPCGWTRSTSYWLRPRQRLRGNLHQHIRHGRKCRHTGFRLSSKLKAYELNSSFYGANRLKLLP